MLSILVVRSRFFLSSVLVILDPIIHDSVDVLPSQHVQHDAVRTVAPWIEPSHKIFEFKIFSAERIFDLAVLRRIEAVGLKEFDKLRLVFTKRNDGDKFKNAEPPQNINNVQLSAETFLNHLVFLVVGHAERVPLFSFAATTKDRQQSAYNML